MPAAGRIHARAARSAALVGERTSGGDGSQARRCLLPGSVFSRSSGALRAGEEPSYQNERIAMFGA